MTYPSPSLNTHTHHIDGKLFFTVHMCMVFLKFIVYWIFFILLYNFPFFLLLSIVTSCYFTAFPCLGSTAGFFFTFLSFSQHKYIFFTLPPSPPPWSVGFYCLLYRKKLNCKIYYIFLVNFKEFFFGIFEVGWFGLLRPRMMLNRFIWKIWYHITGSHLIPDLSLLSNIHTYIWLQILSMWILQMLTKYSSP